MTKQEYKEITQLAVDMEVIYEAEIDEYMTYLQAHQNVIAALDKKLNKMRERRNKNG